MAPIQKRGLAALQLWCQKVTAEYPNVTITDLSSSFRDGLAFNAIIHHFRPHLFDYYSLKPNDILGNNAHAYKIAEEELNVPALLDPQDMVETESPDKKSVALYLAQFYHLFKNENISTTSSPNISLNRLSESDSIIPSSASSDGSESSEGTPSATPTTTRTSRHFNRSRNELIEKYGEDLFNNSKDDEDGNKLDKKAPIWDKLESQNKKNTETPTKFQSNKNSPTVASMCKHFENAKVSAS